MRKLFTPEEEELRDLLLELAPDGLTEDWERKLHRRMNLEDAPCRHEDELALEEAA